MLQYICIYLIAMIATCALVAVAQQANRLLTSFRRSDHRATDCDVAAYGDFQKSLIDEDGTSPQERGFITLSKAAVVDSLTSNVRECKGATESSPTAAPTGTPLQGLSFAITGKLAVKREWVASLIRRYGGEVHSRLRHDTRYLVQGDTGVRYTDKENRARQYGTEVIYESELCTMIGIRFDEFVSNPTAFAYASSEEQQRHECRTAHSREARSIARATDDLRTTLQLMADSSTITFAQPVRVMVADSDEIARCTSLQMHRTASHSKEYTLTTTEGDTVYLDDVHTGCIADLYQAAVA